MTFMWPSNLQNSFLFFLGGHGIWNWYPGRWDCFFWKLIPTWSFYSKSPWKIYGTPKGSRIVFQPYVFRGETLTSGVLYILIWFPVWEYRVGLIASPMNKDRKVETEINRGVRCCIDIVTLICCYIYITILSNRIFTTSLQHEESINNSKVQTSKHFKKHISKLKNHMSLWFGKTRTHGSAPHKDGSFFRSPEILRDFRQLVDP